MCSKIVPMLCFVLICAVKLVKHDGMLFFIICPMEWVFSDVFSYVHFLMLLSVPEQG